MGAGTLVSHVTLRLLKPECALDKSWCQEELPVAVKRAVTLLHSHTITSRVGKGEPGKDGAKDRRWWELVQERVSRLTAWGFLKLWPLASLPAPWPWFPHLKNGGLGPGGGFLSPVLVFRESV